MNPLSPPGTNTTDTYPERMAARRAALDRQLEHIFPNAGHFVWELGCGHGHFLAAYAAAHPHVRCVGIDIMSDRIARAERKRDRAQLENLFFLRTDARLFLQALPPKVSFSELFILFPDPWPKSRHHKHRILQPEFLAQAALRATPDSRLCFRTDYAPYFADAQETVRTHSEWALTEEAWPFEFATVFQTRAADYQSFIARRIPPAPIS